MKKKSLFIILMVLVLVCSFFYLDNSLIKDNYYKAINSNILKEKKLKDDEYSWSYFLEAQDRVDDKVNLVVKDILSGNNKVLSNKELNVIKEVYEKALDMDKRNDDGIRDLEPYIRQVFNVSTVSELVDVIILVERDLGIGLISNIEILPDYKDNTKNIIYFYPVVYAFGASSDYIIDDDYMTYKAYIRRACVQLWKSYGYSSSSAREVVDRVFSFYEEVASYSKLADKLGDITSYYNIVSEEEINRLYNNVGGKYLSRLGVSGKVYSLVDEGQYKYLNDSLTKDNLEVWKEVIVTKILSNYASYAGEEYVRIVDNLNLALTGSKKDKNDEERAFYIVKGLFSYVIDKVYVDNYLTSKDKKDTKEMFLEIKKIFKKRLEDNKWLSAEAKDKAIFKLEKMEIVIGLEDVEGYSIANGIEDVDKSLISEVISLQKRVRQEELKRLDSGVNSVLINQTLVNAYYQVLDNSIVIPVAFFELINDNANYYERLGTLGMILAHEVTHAFDSNGSKFDNSGNLNNWWSEEDRREFEKLKQGVSDYYSKYEVMEGKYINGDKTVNENIADLGAMECIVDIANSRKASDQEFKIMFSSFANVWASLEKDEYMELLLLQDVHAPNQFRVNAVLSSVDDYYRVYDIYPWHDMWKSKDNRVKIW